MNVATLHGACKRSTGAGSSSGGDWALSTAETGQKLQEKQILHAVPP